MKTPKSEIILPKVRPLSLSPITWEYRDDKYCLNEKDYKSNLNNYLDLLEYIKQSNYRINFYENTILQGE